MDVFVSYSRNDEIVAERVADALRGEGFRAWRDDRLPAHRTYGDVIEERLKSAAGGPGTVVGRRREIAMGPGRGGYGARRRAPLSRRCSTEQYRRSPSTRSNAPTFAAGTVRRTLPGWGKLKDSIPRSPERRRRARRPRRIQRAPVVDLRAAVPEHERRSRAGIFQRRHQRGHHHRPVQDFGAGGRRAEHGLHLQGPVGRRGGSRAQARRQPCS